MLNGDGVQFVNRVETLKTDFLMVHWLEDAFLHFDPVFDNTAKKPHSVSPEVITRFKEAITNSPMCQAYRKKDWTRLRELASQALKLPSGPTKENTVHHTDLVWGFLQTACNNNKFNRLRLGTTTETSNNDDPVKASVLRSWYTNWDNALLSCAQRDDKATFAVMCREHSKTKGNSNNDFQMNVRDLWLSVSSVALPILKGIASALPAKSMKVYRGLRFLNKSKADEIVLP